MLRFRANVISNYGVPGSVVLKKLETIRIQNNDKNIGSYNRDKNCISYWYHM